MILISIFRNTGECLRIETTETSTIKRCSKYNRGLCNTNLLITTDGEKTKITSDVSNLLKKTSECRDSVVSSGLLSITSTSAESEKSIKQKNLYIGIESCNTSEFSNYSKLVTLDELLFLTSFRGRIGKEAEKLRKNIFLSQTIRSNAESCLSKQFSDSERTLISDIILQKKLEEDTITTSK